MTDLFILTSKAVLPLLAAVLGAALGALLHGGYIRRNFFLNECSKCDDHRLRKVLTKMQELAEGTAIQVGRHSEAVERISSELTSPAMATGEPDAITGIVERLLQANHQMQRQLELVEARLQEQAELIETQANEVITDGLTGLMNRRAFDEAIEEAFTEFSQKNIAFAVTMLDVDHFKQFNDTHGHLVGDEVLKLVGKTLIEHVRDRELPFRYGGEEFAMLHRGVCLEEAVARADSFRKAIAAIRLQHDQSELRVTASIGTAEHLPGENMFGLLDRADGCLYASKAAGRNCTHFHNGREIIKYGQPSPATKITEETPVDPLPVPAPATDASENTPPRTEPTEPKEPAGERREQVAPSCARRAGRRSDTDLPTAAKVMRKLSFDSIPPLPNRTFFCSNLNKRLASLRRGGEPLAVIFFQVDDAGNLAGSFGSDGSAIVTKAISQFLTVAGRASDTVAQVGPFVFAVLLHNAGTVQAVTLATRVQSAAKHCVLPTPGGPLRFTLSAGIVTADPDDNYKGILTRAEQTLLSAVAQGGNRCCCHDGEAARLVDEVPTLVDV